MLKSIRFEKYVQTFEAIFERSDRNGGRSSGTHSAHWSRNGEWIKGRQCTI